MSAAKKPASRVGRPSSGVTKDRPSLSLSKVLIKKARKVAFKEGVSLSAWIENAIAKNLNTDGES